MAQSKKNESAKVRRAASRKRRGLQPGDKVVNRSKQKSSRTSRLDLAVSHVVFSKHHMPKTPFSGHVRQAEVARELLGELNGLARKLADLILDKFPHVEVPEGTTRTKVAQEEALALLDETERKRTAAIEKGISCARRCLKEAFDQLSLANT